MTNVSKVPLEPRVYKSIRNDLRKAVSRNAIAGASIIEALLTKAERIMLSKRLAAIILLENGASYYRISKLLKVSVSTAIRLNKYRNQGLFIQIQRTTKNRQGGNLSLMEHAELILAAGMPSRSGRRYDERLKKLRAKLA